MKVEWKMNPDFIQNLVEDVILPAVEKQNEVAIKTAADYAPKNTGKLAESIDGKVASDKDKITSVVGTPLEYGIYQELGTSKFSGKHYLRRGMLRSIKILEEEIKKNME
ncbi:MAG: HK97 gp10 family phage protein [Candidatus Heimdallarchaeaceae archaeon]